MTDVKMIEDLNRGRMAGIILDNLKPYLDRHRQVLIERMKGSYIMGKVDFPQMMAHLGSLVALDELEQEIKSNFLKGQRAAKELNSDDSKTH
jgi:hypothetical protein